MAQFTFQEQLLSIMEILAKAAVAEIKRRVEDSCAEIRLELSHSQRDIDTLKRRCHVMENELRKARGRGRRRVFMCGTSEKLSMPFQSVCARETGANVCRAEQTVTPQELDAEQSIQHIHQTVHIVEETPEPPVIKEEGNENGPWRNGQGKEEFLSEHHNNMPPSPDQRTPEEPNQFSEDVARASTHMQPVLEPSKRDETSGLRLHVKTEKEDEEENAVPDVILEGSEQRMDESEHLKFALEQRDGQLWPSACDPENDGEEEERDKSYSTALSCDFPAFSQPVDTTSEQSANDTNPVEETQMELYSGGQVRMHEQSQPHWCQERRHQRHRHDGVAHLNAHQRHRTLTRPREANVGAGMSSQTGSNVATQSLWGCGRGGINTVRRLRTHLRAAVAVERRFSCSFCERRFARFGQLKEHLRSHTGERPYQCAQCGRSFTKQGNLIRHAVVHSGEKPYQCALCGKCFTQRSSLKSHQKTHTTERDGTLPGLNMYESVRDSHSSLSISQTRGFV